MSPQDATNRPLDLMARVDAEVRDRVAEAVDAVCLQKIVRSRQARQLPAPAPDSVRDRAEYEASVEAFLARLGDDLTVALVGEQRKSLEAAAERAAPDRLSRLLGVQVALAKLLPDYWQRFDEVRAAYDAEAARPAPESGSDRSGWLDRLLGG